MKRIIKMPLNNDIDNINNNTDEYTDEAYERLLDAIYEAHELQEDCNELFTLSLIALENYRYDEAFKYAAIVTQHTDSIEQKIAAMHLMTMAIDKNKEAVDAFLNVIYKQ